MHKSTQIGFMVSMVLVLIVFIFVINIMACSSSNENLVEGNTVVVVSDETGELHRNCDIQYDCTDLNERECLRTLRDEAQRYIENGKNYIKFPAENTDLPRILIEYSIAYCYFLEAKTKMHELKINNLTQWRVLYNSGFVKLIDTNEMMLGARLRQLETFVK
jgi:hypothetical protein